MRIQTNDRHLEAARASARDELLRDADTLTDWLGGECMYGQAVTVRGHLHEIKLLGLIDAGLPVADLVAVAVDRGQPPASRLMALDTIVDRYLATRADEIERKASSRAGEIAEQEAADFRELAA